MSGANHGEWQAQGDDINQQRGHRVQWADSPTKIQGVGLLKDLAKMCTSSQRKLRSGRACRDARKFVEQAPAGGYPTTSRQFYARDDVYPNARIDLEIYGVAFTGTDNGGSCV